VVGLEKVHPDQGVFVLQMLGNVVEREVPVGDLALAPQDGVDVGGSHEGSVLPVAARVLTMALRGAPLTTIAG
jgi:hypothetical protein